MTTYDDSLGVDADDDVTPSSTVADRRSPASTDRVSWASKQPFIVRQPTRPGEGEGESPASGEFNPVARAADRRQLWAGPWRRRAFTGDFVIAFVSFLLMTLLSRQDSIAEFAGYVALSLVAAISWCAALGLLRAYDSRRTGEGPDEFNMIGRAAVLVLVTMALSSYSLGLLLPRRFVLVVVPMVALFTAIYRYVLRLQLHRQRDRGQALMRTIVVGHPSAVDDVVRDLSSVPYHGYQVIGTCVPTMLSDRDLIGDLSVLGSLSDIPQAVIDHQVDVVIVAGSGMSSASLRRLSWALERTGAELVVAPGLVEVAGPRLHVRPAAGLSLLHVESPDSRQGQMLAKAALDRTLGTALFLAALPVIAVSALLVRLSSRGPAFFPQERIGQDGRPFRLWKLRSMVVDAEDRRHEVLDSSDRDGLMFKMRQDPRVTTVGRFLRRYSLDELPQLWNVVRGDMSLVGPRPPLRVEYDAYHDAVHRRLRVKPGLTGLWQVSGRADLSWEESVRLDLRYVDNWSVAFDLQILWKTARAVVRGSGAY
ncbi:sugar transferase [Angustibacter luteus]|uniref:Sugar transferase n=1 Tax=Angustibacter luteus TaxID=658456 RepID=A0ABW1JCE0_9ACTN